MLIFNSYIKLPEGNRYSDLLGFLYWFNRILMGLPSGYVKLAVEHGHLVMEKLTINEPLKK